MKTETTELSRSEQNAKASLESIIEMVAALENDPDGTAREAIQDDALEVCVRTDWRTPGAEDSKPTEFYILLTTGGPALRIRGALSRYCEPESAILEHQDWGTKWTEYRTTSEEDDALLAYAQCFYFGE